MEEKKTSTFEKIAYAMGDSGSGSFVWLFTSSFLMLYYTDGVLAAAGTIGTMMLIMRVFDGFSDILFGVLLENTSTRIGKARPWFGASSIPLVISFILMFHVPSNIGKTAQLIYISITYFLMTVVMYTINNLSLHSMLSRISLDSDDRNKTSTVRSIMGGVVGLLVSVFTTVILNALGGEKQQHSWTVIVFIYGALCLAMQSVCFFGCREKIPALKGDKRKGNNVSEGFKELFHNKYFYITILIFVMNSLSGGTLTGAAIYYARDVLLNSNSYAMLAIAFLLPGVIAQAFVPALTRKFGKKRLFTMSSIVVTAGSVIGMLFPRNLIVVLIALVINSIGGAPFQSLIYTLAPDLVDYLEKKTGKRWEGLTTSATSFGSKVGTGLGIAIVGWVLDLGNYSGELAVQPQSAQIAEIALVFLIPMLAGILRLMCVAKWDLS